MYQKFKDLFTKNLPWKIFSILVSCLLWFVAMNINNPTEIKTFSISLNLSNLTEQASVKNISILNIDELESSKIEIKLKATRPILDELTKMFSDSSIKASLDITNIINLSDTALSELNEPIEISAQIKTNLSSIPYPNNNFEVLSISPSILNIDIDNIITVSKKVSIKKIGTEKSGHISSTPEISSEYVQVTGAKSIINTIDSVYLEVDVSGQSTTFSKNIPPIAYDKDGNVIEKVYFNMEYITVKIPIVLQGKIKINQPELTGNLLPEYSVKSVSYSPKELAVAGSSNYLKSINSINLPNINISNLTSSKEFKFKASEILEGYNLELKNNEDTEITILIEIEKKVEHLIIMKSSELLINSPDDIIVNIPETFNIKVSGLENDIKTLDSSKIKASVDFMDLEPGIHKVEIDVSLPNNIFLVSIPYINVTISKTSDENSFETITSTENSSETSSKKIDDALKQENIENITTTEITS